MHILATVDFSANTRAVLAHASRLSKAFDARLHIVHVENSAPYFVNPEDDSSSERKASLTAPDGKRIDLQSIKDRLAEEGITAVFEQLEGPTAESVLDVSNRIRADYIVMGAQRHSRLYHLLFGVPGESIIHRSSCPVVIVPDPKGRTA